MTSPGEGGATVPLPTATAHQAWRAVRGIVREHRALTIGAVLVLVVGTGVGLLVPLILGLIVDVVVYRDVVVDRGVSGAITGPVLALAGIAVVQSGLLALAGLLVARLGETVLADLRERLVARVLALPQFRTEQSGSGDLVARVSGDVAVVSAAVRRALPALAGAGLTIALTVVGMASLDWRFAVAGLLGAPWQYLTLRWYLRRSAPVFAAERIAEGERTQQLLDSIAGAATVKVFGLTERHTRLITDRSAVSLGYGLSANRLATRFFGRLNLAEFLGLGATLLVGFLLVGSGSVTVGAAAAAALYFHRLFDPINTLLGEFGEAQEAAAGLARLVGIADLPADPPQPERAMADSSVRAQGLSFAYSSGHPVLTGVDLAIAPGEHVALVGTTGAGKTTLAALLAGIHRPTAGSVHLGRVALPDLGHAQLRRTVGMISQEVHTFAGSVADDLGLAAPDASAADLRAALHEVGVDWVDSLPDGLDTVVGEGGLGLDATRSQQLALARLLLAAPDIAILDEASAEAGSAGARILDAATGRVIRGRTALIVAHRLSQAAAADRIVVMERGRIVEQGSHEALLCSGGAYSQLWAAWTSTGRPDGER